MTACGEAVLVLLIGDLGAPEARQLRRGLLHDLRPDPAQVVVDASAATWLCDDVLLVLAEASHLVEEAGGQLVVVDPPPVLALPLRRRGIRARASQIGVRPRS